MSDDRESKASAQRWVLGIVIAVVAMISTVEVFQWQMLLDLRARVIFLEGRLAPAIWPTRP